MFLTRIISCTFFGGEEVTEHLVLFTRCDLADNHRGSNFWDMAVFASDSIQNSFNRFCFPDTYSTSRSLDNFSVAYIYYNQHYAHEWSG